jgi:uncharacterized damage-inducible protein DinB
MNWTKLLEGEIEAAYRATDGLMQLCDGLPLNWKPSSGSNWMTTGQLLHHLTNACGHCCRGFVTGDWGMPKDAKPEDMTPPAEKMPSVASVAEARRLLAEDKAVALRMVKEAGEKDLDAKLVAAPWDPTQKPLGLQFAHMVQHLASHKSQLFYYLKLQGKPVHTGNLWGM